MQQLAAYGFALFLAWFLFLGPILGGLSYSPDTGELEATGWFQASGLIVLVGFLVGAAGLGLWESWQKRRGR